MLASAVNFVGASPSVFVRGSLWRWEAMDIPKEMGPPNMGKAGPILFPYCLGILMGIVWEAYHKKVPLLGFPGITLELMRCL